MGSARFKHQSSLSTQPFGIFRGFPRNSRKYRLVSLRKNLTEGTSPIGPCSTSGQMALKPTTQLVKMHFKFTYKNRQQTYLIFFVTCLSVMMIWNKTTFKVKKKYIESSHIKKSERKVKKEKQTKSDISFPSSQGVFF